MKIWTTLLFWSCVSLFPTLLQAQEIHRLIGDYLNGHLQELSLMPTDIAEWEITDQYLTRHNGVTQVHIRQQYHGIPVYNGVANFAIRGGQVLHMAGRLQQNIAQRVAAEAPVLSPAAAISAAAQATFARAPTSLSMMEEKGPHNFVYSKGDISQENIPIRLMYVPGPEGELFLAWDLSILLMDGKHWWSVRVDALSGALIDKVDWMLACTFPENTPHQHHSLIPHIDGNAGATQTSSSPGQYRVFSYRLESPSQGGRTLEIEPADSIASPYGWHDTNALAGAEYTITRGNNVYAREDRDDNDTGGYSPDGGAQLIFDYPLNLNQAPIGYQDAAITNLFYMNNVMHDLWYQYGFDEQSGNFQQNNYGKGGQAGDYVNADAQDGGGTNNANFGTPPDGTSGRMQMYLWSAASSNDSLLTVNAPGSIARKYRASGATFGPGVSSTPLTADVVLVNDGTTPDPNDGCETLVNAAALSGKIALINRGTCSFVNKVLAAQNAGALGVIIVNNVAGAPFTMGGTSSAITIPSVMISQADGNLLKAQLSANVTVNATLQDQGNNSDRDGDLDNGIIAHEYGHGISTRLTGGPSNSSCLSNAEQMGEGWSDWFALMLNIDTSMVTRGIGTYATSQPITSTGIRNAPYSRDFNINPFTYANTNDQANVSQPHGIGFVWSTMLWDLALNFIDTYGFDEDLYYGNGGNNLVMQLVIDGIKLQNCNPGFVDGRDAILLADQINNGGANKCLIWETFARRGLGFSASQGQANSRADQVEAFDLPPSCLIPVTPPVASYEFQLASACNDRVSFTDQSSNLPQRWFWDFGDGNSDTTQNATHVYQQSGTYHVVLITSNSLGSDTLLRVINIALAPAPSVSNATICVDEPATLAVNGTGFFTWYDAQGTMLDTGAVFQTAPLGADTAFFVQQTLTSPLQHVGPVDGSFAAGGYHNTSFTGTLNFTAIAPFTFLSAWVDAGAAGPRTFFVWDSPDGAGNIVDQVTVNLAAGAQRVTLNLNIPAPGTYSVGGTMVNLYRNNAGANYPYNLSNLVSITSSSSTSGALAFYYYLYDWEVQGESCKSDKATVNVTVANAEFEYVEDSLIKEVNFTDRSAGATSWLWNFGDGDTSLLQNPVHLYSTAGVYLVTLTINGSCTLMDTILVKPAVGVTALVPGLEVALQPNPATERFRVVLNHSLAEDLAVTLIAADGRIIGSKTLSAGSTSLDWDAKGIAAGVYLVRIQGFGGVQTLRQVIGQD